HDIGKLAICIFMPSDASRIYQIAEAQRKTHFEAEMAVMKATHQEVGKLVADMWCIPDTYIKAIEAHHNPVPDDLDIDQLTAIVHVANAIAYEVGLGFAADRQADPADQLILDYLTI